MPGVAFRLRDAVPRVLKQCGDDLTPANVMRQVANLHDLVVPMLLPGIKINTSPTRFAPINQEQMVRFNGTSWERFGDISYRQLIPRPAPSRAGLGPKA
jgi:branched-chain amino acid transport system substrate-binding protein